MFPNSLIKYIIKVPNEEAKATLCVYYKRDGKITFTFNEGKNSKLAINVANHLIENIKFDIKNEKSIYIKEFSIEDFNSLSEYLTEYCGAKLVNTVNLPHGTKYDYESIYGDKIHLNHFINGAFNVQGQSGLLKSQVIEALSKYLSYGEIVDITLKSLDITDLDKTAAEKLLENRLPVASQMISETVKLLILPTFLLERIKGDTTDYSFMVFPIFRGFEGFIKQLFLGYGIILTANANFGTYLEDKVKNGFFTLNSQTEAIISCNFTKRAIEKAYNFYRNHRHAIFHVDGTLISTKLIVDPKEALSLINETCEYLEKCSRAITEKEMSHLR